MSEEIDQHRRQFLATVAMTFAAAQLALVGCANEQAGNAKPADMPATKPGTNTSFASMKQIDTGLLNVGYAEAGPTDGSPVRTTNRNDRRRRRAICPPSRPKRYDRISIV
jgi:hypothetical protein